MVAKREWAIEPVVRLKLATIRKGADIASVRLWEKRWRREATRAFASASNTFRAN
jgi:hypothetical protein